MIATDAVTTTGRVHCRAVDYQGRTVEDFGWTENLVLTQGLKYFGARNAGIAGTGVLLNGPISGLIISDGTTPVTAADTTSTGSTQTYRQALDAVPTQAGNVTSYQFTVPQANANFSHAKLHLTNASTTGLTDGLLVTGLLVGPYPKTAIVAFVYTYQLTNN